MRVRIAWFAASAAGTFAACAPDRRGLPGVEAAAYADSIDLFHKKRTIAIAGPEGWATLTGLWWLKPGENRLGSDRAADIVVPVAGVPARLGSVFVEGDSARFEAAQAAAFTVDSQPLTAPLRLRSDVEGRETVLRFRSLVVNYITRAGRKAVRIKDTLHVARRSFPGLRFFPTDAAWRLSARFVPRPRPDSMMIVDVLGIETKMSWPGELRFQVQGKEYVLQVIREPEDHGAKLFVMFRDATNGRETYPAMRYTNVNPPDSLGRTILDFNQSWSPPCAFTNFATCPLPPPRNTLPFRVTAGELAPAVRH